MKALALAACVLLATTTTVAATDYTSEATVLATFQCPESLKDDAERASSLQEFMQWIRARHPDWSAPKITGYRLYLLERHHCDKTLAELRAHPDHGI
jgi:hypothetical protein